MNAVKRDRKNLAEAVSDTNILELMGVASDGVPTLAGLMVFSRYPQAYFPQLCITAVVIQGVSMGETGAEGERFLANQRITGPIQALLDEAVDFVRRNGRVKTIVDDLGRRRVKQEFPPKAVREAILNALVHRDYSIYTQNIPIRIIMYSNRMEIINSGGLYGHISIDSLGKVRPDTRNAALANILELLDVTENRYFGIPTIRKEFEVAGLPEPVFAVRRGEFIVTFFNDFERGTDVIANQSMNASLLSFCKSPRTRLELISFTGFSPNYTVKLVKALINAGKMRMTIPDKPKSPKQQFVAMG